MIKQELRHRSHHYALLCIGLAALLSAFIMVQAETIRTGLAIGVGLFYFVWGVMTHQGEIKTLRLMLEYACVGILAALILFSLIQTL